jgi:hypothetical protein
LLKEIPSSDNILERHGPSNGICSLCCLPEDANHIFFACPMAKFLWSAVRELLGGAWNPTCTADVFRFLARQFGQPKRVISICCAALLRTIWNIRNKFTIEGSFPSQSADAFYKLSMYLQVWRPVARQRDRAVLDVTIRRIRVLHLEQRDG